MSEVEKERRRERVSDVEELRDVLTAVADFLKEIREPIEGLLESLLGSLRGDKLGEDVANFYKRLKEAGMSDDEVRDFTRRYLEQRLMVGDLISKFISLMERHAGKPKVIVSPMKERKVEEEKRSEKGKGHEDEHS